MKSANKFVLPAIIMLIGAGTLLGCKKTETTSDGITYTYIKEGKDDTKDGDYILYHFEAKTANDSTFISSYSQPLPAYLQKNSNMPTNSGIDEIFLNLRRGDSIVVNASAEKVFGQGMTPPFLKAEEEVTISIGVINVIEEELFQDYFNDLVADAQQKQAKEAENQLASDVEKIEKYISENNLQANRTESGLFYVIQKEGNGAEVERGNSVSVDYVGYLLDGTVFDTSIEAKAREANMVRENFEYKPITIDAGTGSVIRGWDEGLMLLREGSEAKFLIPSPLAYGPSQRGEIIKPNSILVFDVKITKVEK